ncbi:MAG: ASCH domain-containing protein [Pikeienuella sp.]|uniref:ASCH domain-containing protein n=1 Tax=Pikeienuella sp. TaxID=2831957 RepID=UPI00391ADAEC
MNDLPEFALSVRQPWAWAIIAGGKDIENRHWESVRRGGMVAARILIHASGQMQRQEYDSAAAFMAEIGVTCPPPATLRRGGLIGAVTVRGVVSASASPWFFGPRGLVLDDPEEIEFIPARGQLGYFRWSRAGDDYEAPAPAKWMLATADNAPGAAILQLAQGTLL